MWVLRRETGEHVDLDGGSSGLKEELRWPRRGAVAPTPHRDGLQDAWQTNVWAERAGRQRPGLGVDAVRLVEDGKKEEGAGKKEREQIILDLFAVPFFKQRGTRVYGLSRTAFNVFIFALTVLKLQKKIDDLASEC